MKASKESNEDRKGVEASWGVDFRSMAQGILSRNRYLLRAALFLLYFQVCVCMSTCEYVCVSSVTQIFVKCKYSVTPSIQDFRCDVPT